MIDSEWKFQQFVFKCSIYNCSEYAGILLQMKLRFALKQKMAVSVSTQRTEEKSSKQVGRIFTCILSSNMMKYGVLESQISILLNSLIYFEDCSS